MTLPSWNPDTWGDRVLRATVCRVFGHRRGRKIHAVICTRCHLVLKHK